VSTAAFDYLTEIEQNQRK